MKDELITGIPWYSETYLLHVIATQYTLHNTTVKKECGGPAVECLIRDRGAAGSNLTGVTALGP